MAEPIDLQQELRKTSPDYVVFVPGSVDGSSHDTGNEHFFVFDAPDGQEGSLLAIWTQSTFEHQPDHRAVMARSDDGGRNWSAPWCIAGEPLGETPASWAFPVVAASGRIYVFFQRKNMTAVGWAGMTGWCCKYSDDAGKTWSAEGVIPPLRTPPGQGGEPKTGGWLVWQRPQRLSEGKYFAGVTRGVLRGVTGPNPIKSWVANPSVIDFLRFENIDDLPRPEEIEIRLCCGDDRVVKVGMTEFPNHPVAQEPSLVPLPDGRLFCAMRTITGSPYYTISSDAGRTWTTPQVLRRSDGGEPLLHPLSPCPIYALPQGDYFMLIHNHGRWLPENGNLFRRPLCILRGEYRPDARQPIWFSEPKLFMDTGGVPLGFGGVTGLAMYSTVTHRGGETVLWYPDRKFFLLGKKIPRQLLDPMAVAG